ncbi:hypothetical protein P7K49_024392 [Saguinus oedipus]|uniref:Uncharacterized protein n=1 Tax=Saguinus oedipus TaxID=9490 RepID=A0ABQ9UPD6_SAGOE|nr:hypothetical protein P7K49_024392 [Saguinus oedipus]
MKKGKKEGGEGREDESLELMVRALFSAPICSSPGLSSEVTLPATVPQVPVDPVGPKGDRLPGRDLEAPAGPSLFLQYYLAAPACAHSSRKSQEATKPGVSWNRGEPECRVLSDHLPWRQQKSICLPTATPLQDYREEGRKTLRLAPSQLLPD